MELKDRTVLAVDEDGDALDAVVDVLESSGALVMRAGTAGEALATVVGAQPDVVLVSLALAGKDGLSLVRRMRTLSANKGGRVPAATSGPDLLDGDDAAAWREAGAQAHLTRPYDPVELLAVVRSLAGRQVERRRSVREESPAA